MKHIINIPQLDKVDGSPYRVRTSENEKDGEVYSLAQWVELMVNGIPMHKCTFADAEKAINVLKACHTAKESMVIDLDEKDYAWLEEVLFSDSKGKTLSDNKFEGAYALSFGLVALAMKRGLEQFQPPVQLVKAAE